MLTARVPLVVAAVLLWAGLSESALQTYNFTIHSGSRAPGDSSLPDPLLHMTDCYTDGFTREVYLINGQQPGPLIEADEGDELEIFVKNELPVESTIHWHG